MFSRFARWAFIATAICPSDANRRADSYSTPPEPLPGVHGPPPGADPMTFGFYATPEIPKPIELEVVGRFPRWLSGSLYRGAAGSWDAGNWSSEHLFDGYSRTHRFEIANGTVSYRSRNSSQELYDFVEETGQLPIASFAQDPCKIIFGAFESHFRDGTTLHGTKSAASIKVSWLPNFPGLDRNTTSPAKQAPFKTLVGTTDSQNLQQIDPVTLEPIELFSHQAENPSILTGVNSAAHSASFDDGWVYNYILDRSVDPPEYRIFGADPDTGLVRVLATVDDAPAAYVHTLFSTKNHLILIVWQADFMNSESNTLDDIGPWDPERKSLFYVVDRVNGGLRAKYESEEAFFGFHEVNSFETADGDIVLDLPTMEDASFLNASRIDNLRRNVGQRVEKLAPFDVPGIFTRFRLPDPSDHTASTYANGTLRKRPAETVFKLPHRAFNLELPRINPEVIQTDYRYAYGVHVETPGMFVDSIIKIDVKTHEPKVWMPEHRGMPSEPVFAPAPNDQAEDDGVLLSVVMDAKREKSSLVAIDPKTMETMGEARMPIIVGYGFHGVWGFNA